MTFRLGLTGSIGMGKSTTAQIFQDEGCAVWDADAAVHRLYSNGGAAVSAISAAFPDAVEDGHVSREALKKVLEADPSALSRIEKIVHPLVRADREHFTKYSDADVLVFDIPLLFETQSQEDFDAVATVYVDAATQRERVLDRGTMSEEQLDFILAKQLPAEEKKRLADYVILTDTLEHARQQVQSILSDIRAKTKNA